MKIVGVEAVVSSQCARFSLSLSSVSRYRYVHRDAAALRHRHSHPVSPSDRAGVWLCTDSK